MTPLLSVLDLEKHYGSRRLFEGVSFTVNAGDRVGLIGLNGSGKSTLLRVVVGAAMGSTVGGADPDDLPDMGEVRKARTLLLAYVPQEPHLDLASTVEGALRIGQGKHAATMERLDEVDLALDGASEADLDVLLEEQAMLHERLRRLGGWDVSHEVDAMADALELPPLDARIGTLSGGERRRVAIAQALLGHPDLLALDEPTNHLDPRAITWLEGWLASRVEALFLVTHDRTFLDRVATRILELDRGHVYAYEGNYTRYLEQQAERLAIEGKAEDRRSAYVRRELEWIRRKASAQRKKDHARVDRFESAVASKPASQDAAPGERIMRFRLPEGPRLGKTVLELRKVTRRSGPRVLFQDLDFSLLPGERVGIVGPNGAGKTTLIRTMLGQLPAEKGEVRIGSNTRFAYLDQGRIALDDDRTVIQEVADGNDFVEVGGESLHVRSFLRQLLFDDRTIDVPVGRLSGGERNRVMLAKLLRRGGNVLVLDEPTNDLDLQTLAVLEEALVEYPGAVLVVSHDRWFLDKVATSILAFEADGRVVRYAGNYGDWERQTGGTAKWARFVEGFDVAGGGVAGAPPPPQEQKAERANEAPRRKLTWKEKKELEGSEAAILAAEAKVAALEAELADPATYRAGGGKEKGRALDAARATVEALYARWSELSAVEG